MINDRGMAFAGKCLRRSGKQSLQATKVDAFPFESETFCGADQPFQNREFSAYSSRNSQKLGAKDTSDNVVHEY